MESKDFCCYEFGEFQLDTRRRNLSKNGEKIPLTARNFDLLLFMIENGGRILEHDELLEKVWAGTFVEQATLKKGISALRHILGECPESEFIKTIPRRGYSFVLPVRLVPEENGFSYYRETEQQIIIEEFEETDDFETVKNVVEIPSASAKTLPSAKTEKNKLSRFVILGIGTTALFILTFFGLKPYFSKNVQARFSFENSRFSRVTNNGKVLAGTAISPDGAYLLYSLTETGGTSLWVRQIAVNRNNRLTPLANSHYWAFAFAPDNSYVYYIIDNTDEPKKSGLYKIPLFGGEAERIKENVSSLAVSPDGKRLALGSIIGETRIFTVNTEGEDEREVAKLPPDSGLWGMSWTPDGENLLCTIRKTVEKKPLFYISEISPENGTESIILPAQEKIIFGAVWLSDKSALLSTSREPNADIRQIWQYFPGSAQWQRVTNDNNSYHSVSLTRDGKNIASSQLSRLASIWLSGNISFDRKTPPTKSLLNGSDNFRQITDGVSNFDKVGWLSDGHLIYSGIEDGKEAIFTINGDGTNPKHLTNGEDGMWLFPNVTGNGQNISFLSSRDENRQVWRIDGDGKNPTKMTESDLSIASALILSDNSTVIFSRAEGSETVLFRQTPDKQITQLTNSATGDFAISPDEKLLAVETRDKNTGKFRVELISLEEDKTIKTFDFNVLRQMSFTPDGKNLAYISPNNDVCQIRIQPLDGSENFALTDFQSDEIFGFAWSPDGKSLAVIRGKQLNDAVLIRANAN